LGANPTKEWNVKLRTVLLLAAIVAVILIRWIPHPWNMTPVMAVALFAGAKFRDKPWWGFGAVILAMVVSDLVLGWYSGMWFVYGTLMLVAWWGTKMKKGALWTMGSAAVSAVVFFLLTNLGVWASFGMYDHTLAGLGQCYAVAIPFFRGTLFGNLIYSALLFGVWGLVEQKWKVLQPIETPALIC